MEFRDFFLGDMFCSLTYLMSVCMEYLSDDDVLMPSRISHSFFACMQLLGANHRNVIRHTPVCSDFSPPYQASGVLYNV